MRHCVTRLLVYLLVNQIFRCKTTLFIKRRCEQVCNLRKGGSTHHGHQHRRTRLSYKLQHVVDSWNTVKPVYNDHLWDNFLPTGAHQGGHGPPRWAPEGRRQSLLARVNWYFQSSLNTLLNKSHVINFMIEVVVTDRFHCINFNLTNLNLNLVSWNEAKHRP